MARAARRAKRKGSQHESASAFHSILMRIGDAHAPCGAALRDLRTCARTASRTGCGEREQAEAIAAFLGLEQGLHGSALDTVAEEAFPGGELRLSSLLTCTTCVKALDAGASSLV